MLSYLRKRTGFGTCEISLLCLPPLHNNTSNFYKTPNFHSNDSAIFAPILQDWLMIIPGRLTEIVLADLCQNTSDTRSDIGDFMTLLAYILTRNVNPSLRRLLGHLLWIYIISSPHIIRPTIEMIQQNKNVSRCGVYACQRGGQLCQKSTSVPLYPRKIPRV